MKLYTYPSQPQTRTVGGTFEISFMLPKSSNPADMTNTKRKAKNPSR